MDESRDAERLLQQAIYWMLGFDILAITVVLAVASLGLHAVGLSLPGMVQNLVSVVFAANSVQALWYVTRAAGLTAYLLLWLSTAWGLVVSTRILDRLLGRNYTYDFHQLLSLLAIGFTLLHVGVLLADRYLPFSMIQVLVPFASPYRPFWVGVGVIAFYLTLLVSVTFYIRRWIGVNLFRAIHVLSLLAYLGATAHGLLSGTDSPLPSVQVMYFGTFFVVVFLTLMWLGRLGANRPALPDALATSNASAGRR